MKKSLLLLALATAALAAENPFPELVEVSADPYPEVANRIEYQNMVLLPDPPLLPRAKPQLGWLRQTGRQRRARLARQAPGHQRAESRHRPRRTLGGQRQTHRCRPGHERATRR